jgi:hypothetical protein
MVLAVPVAAALYRASGLVQWIKGDTSAMCYAITSSARRSSRNGKVMPGALAVFRFMTNSTLVDCRTGRSAGFSSLGMTADQALCITF